jgi:signal transduction histidine kinase
MHPQDANSQESLRAKAEALIRGVKPPKVTYTEAELQEFLHEHQVYRAELEVQNEELRRTQEQLIEANKRYRMLYEYAPLGYFTLDPKGIITDLNYAGAAMLDSEPSLARGRAFDRYVDAASRELFLDFLAATTDARGIRTVEVKLRKSDKNQAPVVLLESVRMLEPGTAIPAILLAAMDISKLKQAQHLALELNRTLEQRVIERTAEAEHKTKQLRVLTNKLVRAEFIERRRIAQNLHDDLAQVLVAGIMKTAALREHTVNNELDGELTDIGDIFKHATQYTRGLIGDLNPIALRERELTLAVNRLAMEMEKYKLTVTVDSDVEVILEEELGYAVYQSIRELLFNIVKHARTDAAWIRIERNEKDLIVTVRDEGCGMPPTRSPVTSENKESYGLLGIEERVASLGGRFTMQSRPGSGTVCTLTVPLVAEPDAGQPSLVGNGARKKPLSDKTPPYSVLVVDDHTEFRESLKQRLGKHAQLLTVVGEAHDGIEALLQARELKPDIVFMDINMPGMNGIDCTRRLIHEFPNLLIIGLSIRDDDSARKALQFAGAAGLVCKADSAETLFDILNLAGGGGGQLDYV